MDNQNRPKPTDLVVFVESKITVGPAILLNIGVLGDEADRIFRRANEALYRKDRGWEEVFEQAATESEKNAGFRPEEVYLAEAELRKSKGLGQSGDRQHRPLLEGLNMLPKLKTKEG